MVTNEVLTIPGKVISTGCIHCHTQNEVVLTTYYRNLERGDLCYHVQVAPKPCDGCGQVLELVELVGHEEVSEFFDWYLGEVALNIPRIRNMDKERGETNGDEDEQHVEEPA